MVQKISPNGCFTLQMGNTAHLQYFLAHTLFHSAKMVMTDDEFFMIDSAAICVVSGAISIILLKIEIY